MATQQNPDAAIPVSASEYSAATLASKEAVHHHHLAAPGTPPDPVVAVDDLHKALHAAGIVTRHEVEELIPPAVAATHPLGHFNDAPPTEVKAIVDAVNRRIAEEGEDVAYHHLPDDAGLNEGQEGSGARPE